MWLQYLIDLIPYCSSLTCIHLNMAQMPYGFTSVWLQCHMDFIPCGSNSKWLQSHIDLIIYGHIPYEFNSLWPHLGTVLCFNPMWVQSHIFYSMLLQFHISSIPCGLNPILLESNISLVPCYNSIWVLSKYLSANLCAAVTCLYVNFHLQHINELMSNLYVINHTMCIFYVDWEGK